MFRTVLLVGLMLLLTAMNSLADSASTEPANAPLVKPTESLLPGASAPAAPVASSDNRIPGFDRDVHFGDPSKRLVTPLPPYTPSDWMAMRSRPVSIPKPGKDAHVWAAAIEFVSSLWLWIATNWGKAIIAAIILYCVVTGFHAIFAPSPKPAETVRRK